jgi:hypothetical protein
VDGSLDQCLDCRLSGCPGGRADHPPAGRQSWSKHPDKGRQDTSPNSAGAAGRKPRHKRRHDHNTARHHRRPHRCFWVSDDPLYLSYHDEEWGKHVTDDRRLFEKICLEGFQSGLSWLTILRKRENFRAAFDGFDFAKVARYGEDDVERLLADAGIVRHQGKIRSTINNAQRALDLVEEAGSLAAFFWRYVPPA